MDLLTRVDGRNYRLFKQVCYTSVVARVSTSREKIVFALLVPVCQQISNKVVLMYDSDTEQGTRLFKAEVAPISV